MIIYKITNKINGKIYVGQTVQKAQKRWSLHKHQSIERNRPLYRSIRKYGIDKFEMITLEILPKGSSLEQLDERETFWISALNSMVPNGYNLTSGGSGKYHLSSETKARISIANTGHTVSLETREKISKMLMGRPGARKGATHTKEAKAKISQAGIGRMTSAETKSKQSEAHKGSKAYNSKKVMDTTTQVVYNSTGEAARILNLQQTSISSVCLGKRKSTGGKTFKYVV